jgi:hypothetical protein
MELLAPSARQVIEQHTHLFTSINQNGREEEVDGLTIVALILSRIQPNFKVDMYSKITKMTQLTIAQYDNDVQLFFDAIKFLKLHINQKDPTAYTEDAFIQDIFLQMKQESLPAEFRIEFGHQETRWMMNKAKITSASLMDDASAYFINLKNTGNWKTEMSRNTTLPVWMTVRSCVRFVGWFVPSLGRLLARLVPVAVPGLSRGAEPLRVEGGAAEDASAAEDGAPTVAVIGGGIAGCGTAWSLRWSGFRVTLFEARTEISGNAQTFEWDFEMGRKVKSCCSVTA